MLAQAVETEASILVTPESHAANVLLVDDREQNLVALEAILQPLGQNLVLARSGIQALRHLLLDEFAVILMDVQMPGLDGFETANLIRGRPRCRHIPIIFVTAVSTELKYVYRGYTSGAVDYISKPFNPEILRMKVSVFIDLYNKEKELKRQSHLIAESIRREAELKRIEFERELVERHLREVAERLEISVEERTKALTETNRDLESFCYSIAHDLRTPVREILATSNFLMADCADKLTEDNLADLRRQCEAAKNMGKIIEDLLRLSRLGRHAINRGPVGLSEQVTEIFGRVAGERADLNIEVQDGVTADADAGLVNILLHNLIDNAAKYSPEGGTLVFGATEENGSPVYFVRDEGIGFEMEYAPKLFLPFERLVVEPQYDGTGIGLALVQKIVSKHGGRIWAESKPSEGSTFYFTLEGDRE